MKIQLTDEDSTKTELKDVSDSETDLTKSEDVAVEEPSGLFTFATHKTILRRM
jgi:hypothetical protein